jgi:hypothetical protein
MLKPTEIEDEYASTSASVRAMISRFAIVGVSAIAAFTLMAAPPVRAQGSQSWTDAQRLLSSCSEAIGSAGWNSCIDYMEGIKDTLVYLREHNASGIRLPCIPPAITLGQLHDVVVAFIRANPQFYNIGGAPAVYAALVSAFPCQ